MNPVYFLSLLALVYGNLIIDIDVKSDPYIDVRGFIDTTIISDDERATFGIKDAELKEAVAKYTNDKTKPDHVYVKKTNKENDLYAKNNAWAQVQRVVKPKYIDSKVTTTCDEITVDDTTTKAVTVKSEWSIKRNLTIVDQIKHIIYYEDGDFPTENDWGKDFNVSKAISLKNGDNVTECTMKVTVEYDATVTGDIAADYTKKRSSSEGEHHFYAYDVENVREAAKLAHSFVNTETITVTYFKKVESKTGSP